MNISPKSFSGADVRIVHESFDLNDPVLSNYRDAASAMRDVIRDMQQIIEVLTEANPHLKNGSEVVSAQTLVDTLKEQSAVKYGAI